MLKRELKELGSVVDQEVQPGGVVGHLLWIYGLMKTIQQHLQIEVPFLILPNGHAMIPAMGMSNECFEYVHDRAFRRKDNEFRIICLGKV